MKIARFAMSALALTATVVLLSCGDSSPVSPPAAVVQRDLLGTLTQTVNNTLLACTPLPAATTIQTIGSGGGTITVGPHKLVIPAGALSSPVTITGSIKSERVNRVHFEPDGLRFAKQATLTMSYANCGLLSSLTPHVIVYVSPDLKILSQLLSIDNLLNRTVSARLSHFSDYAVDDGDSFSDHSVWW